MKQLWKDCSASQHISTSACLCSQPQSITFPDKKLCFPVYKIVSSVSTDLSPGWVPHITHSQSLAYPLEMDFHWGCACCLETIRVYFTSCSNLISIAMVSWREPWSRSLELNEWMYLSTSEPFKNLPKVLKLSNQTDVKLDEEMSLSISWNRFVLDSTCTLGICSLTHGAMTAVQHLWLGRPSMASSDPPLGRPWPLKCGSSVTATI